MTIGLRGIGVAAWMSQPRYGSSSEGQSRPAHESGRQSWSQDRNRGRAWVEGRGRPVRIQPCRSSLRSHTRATRIALGSEVARSTPFRCRTARRSSPSLMSSGVSCRPYPVFSWTPLTFRLLRAGPTADPSRTFRPFGAASQHLPISSVRTGRTS